MRSATRPSSPIPTGLCSASAGPQPVRIQGRHVHVAGGMHAERASFVKSALTRSLRLDRGSGIAVRSDRYPKGMDLCRSASGVWSFEGAMPGQIEAKPVYHEAITRYLTIFDPLFESAQDANEFNFV